VTRVAALSSEGERHGLGLVSTSEWNSVCTGKHNVVLEGPQHQTDGLLRILEPHLRTPVIWTRSRLPLALALNACGALVIRDVSALPGDEQVALCTWLDGPNDRRQVVSTTVQPLFPLVARGLFNETLYYRLNVVLLNVRCADGAGGISRVGSRMSSP
jgi:hypothetical protein